MVYLTSGKSFMMASSFGVKFTLTLLVISTLVVPATSLMLSLGLDSVGITVFL